MLPARRNRGLFGPGLINDFCQGTGILPRKGPRNGEMMELVVGVFECQDQLRCANIASYANDRAINASLTPYLHPIAGPSRPIRSIGTLGHNTFQLRQA